MSFSNVEINPYITYVFNNKQQTQVIPYITYTVGTGAQIIPTPFVTYIDHDFDNRKKNYIYYINFFNSYMQKTVKCKLYDTNEGFPIPESHLTAICSDGKQRYCPLDRVNKDFDSGVRVNDEYGNEFQVCVGRQENIINKFFPYGNLLIPITNLNDLYNTLKAIFGYARVTIENGELYFIPPYAIGGITKIFAIGLNIRFTTVDNVTLSTHKNGLIHTSYGGDNNQFAKSLLLKMVTGEKIKISYDDSLSYKKTYNEPNSETYNISYTDDNIVRNCLVIGQTVEALPEQSDDYMPLYRSTKWFIYDTVTNYIHVARSNNKKLSYFKLNYLNYPNSTHKYNYFDLQQIKYEPDKFANLL